MSSPIGESLHSLPLAGPGRVAWRRVRLGSDGPDRPECWLRDRVAEDPELVLGACRALGFIDATEVWRLWDIELSVPEVGPVDIVLVSSEGRVALVEVKLARNPENRRKVVAQLLDYAVHLREAVVGDLDELPSDHGVPFADSEDVQRHLQDGDFLLVIASDASDDRAARLTRAVLDRNAIHPWDLVLVDLALFVMEGMTEEGELLCVPHVIGGVRCESRHVVEVKVSNTARDAAVVVKLAPPEPVGPTRIAWSRETFREHFGPAAVHATFTGLVFDWLADAERSRGNSIRYGSGKSPTALVECGGRPFGSVDRHGIWIYGLESLKSAFGDALGEQRAHEVRAMFPERDEMQQYFQVRATDSKLGAAVELVRNWTRSSQRASASGTTQASEETMR
jgi:hypothetical protein